MKKYKGIIKLTDWGVDFEGHNEGSGCPCKEEEEINKEVEYLKSKYEQEYRLEIKDERTKRDTI